MKPLHMRYAQRLNRARGWKGHVSQGRFFSSPLGEAYLWAAIGYVERNPIRAKMVLRAEDYPWSSAAPHCGLTADHVLSEKSEWTQARDQSTDWSSWLAEEDNPQDLEVLRRNVEKGLPCGTHKFFSNWKKLRAGYYSIVLLGVPPNKKASASLPPILLFHKGRSGQTVISKRHKSRYKVRRKTPYPADM